MSKAGRIANAAECCHPLMAKVFKILCAMTIRYQALRSMFQLQPNGLRRMSTDNGANLIAFLTANRVTPRKPDHLSSCQTGDGFTQQSTRQQMLVTKWFQGIEQDDVQVPTDAPMLKGIV